MRNFIFHSICSSFEQYAGKLIFRAQKARVVKYVVLYPKEKYWYVLTIYTCMVSLTSKEIERKTQRNRKKNLKNRVECVEDKEFLAISLEILQLLSFCKR